MAIVELESGIEQGGADAYPHAVNVGPIGRLGRYTATHFRVVLVSWMVVAIGLGLFAPRVETALSGAGWETTGSQSVQARNLINKHFRGLSSYGLMAVMYSPTQTVDDPVFKRVVARVERTLRSDHAVSSVVAPAPGVSISQDGHTAIVQAGAALNSNSMVKAADAVKGKLASLSTAGVQVHLTGASAMWSDFNAANRSAMLKSEVISWPVTLGILLLAFGSLVAAGLPLMLTMVGLMSAAGLLYLGTKVMPISIWAMNFALMFALALGIDYAMFIVHRFRGSLFGHKLSAVDATAVTMDTAGKAVLFSRVTVLISLSAVMLVPSPAFRSMSLGIMLAVIFVLAATLTLLPAVLTSSARKSTASRFRGRTQASTARHGSPPGASDSGASRFATACRARDPRRPRDPRHAAEDRDAVDQGRPRRRLVPDRLLRRCRPRSAPGRQARFRSSHPADAATVTRIATNDPGIARTDAHPDRSNGLRADHRDPRTGPIKPRRRPDDRPPTRRAPAGIAHWRRRRREPRSPSALAAKTPLVIGVILALGFLLLLIALQAPLLAAVGVLTNLLATGAAFGVAKLVFQNGDLHSLLGFQPQGFLDAWGPVFFFAMIFAISMDYTVFLLSCAKEHWDHTHDPKEAMIGGLAHSGRVIFAAGAVMVAVFFTFALSGPLPPKEMGMILGVAVLLDAALIRLLLLPVLLRLWALRLVPTRAGHAGFSPM